MERISVKLEIMFDADIDEVLANPEEMVKKHLREGVECNGEVYFPMFINSDKLTVDGYELNLNCCLDGQKIQLIEEER